MKLILREYLSSLRERGELDAILPDLLSELGLNVISRPGRGTRQGGVDIAAVGKLNSEQEKVYLFAVKPGNLSRSDWDSGSVQDLRPSLNEILDSYIPGRLPPEHRSKPIVLCICIGGDIQESVRAQVTGFFHQNSKPNLEFEEWNGDKLAGHIEASFLREDLLPRDAVSLLRKSLAMLNEPTNSYRHFSELIRTIVQNSNKGRKGQLTSLRQIGVCLWVLFSWCRSSKNLEASYLASELSALAAWQIVSAYSKEKGRDSEIIGGFQSIFFIYQHVADAFLSSCILPYVGVLHGLTSAVHASCSLDANLKMFDVLGRTAMRGLWAYWALQNQERGEAEIRERAFEEFYRCIDATKSLIINNPVLLLPAKDDQAIDVSLAAFFLSRDQGSHDDVKNWLRLMMSRIEFAYLSHGKYPVIFTDYRDLLEHPQNREDEYRRNATSGSILLPILSVWAALLKDEELFQKVSSFVRQNMAHCNCQLWFPDETSESHFYLNDGVHGAVLSSVCIDRSQDEVLKQVFDECQSAPFFTDLSAVKMGFWPLLLVACRHYRLPMPMHFYESDRLDSAKLDDDKER